MGLLYHQVLTILTTPPGNLTYHLVLAFSIAGAVQAAFSLNSQRGTSLWRRMGFGFLLLLLAQLTLGVTAGLAQFLPLPSLLVPALDRTVAVFSLVMIIWLWVFPRPVPLADAAIGLLTLLVITLAAFSVLWGIVKIETGQFNGSAVDLAWNALSLGLLLIGALLLLVRQPEGFGNGLGMISLLFLGHLAHFVAPLPVGDYAGAVRLAQLAAYPLLLTLPQRFSARSLASAIQSHLGTQVQKTTPPELGPQLLKSLLGLPREMRQEQIFQVLAASLAHAFQAELCLLLARPDDNGHIRVESAFDLYRGERPTPASLNRANVPMLGLALERGQTLRLLSHNSSPDLVGLVQALELTHAGSLLAAPIPASGPGIPGGVVLLSPSSRKHWTKADQELLSQTADSIANLLLHARDISGVEAQLVGNSSETVEEAPGFQEIRRENEILQKQLESMKEQVARERSRAERLEAEVSAQAAGLSRQKSQVSWRSLSTHWSPGVSQQNSEKDDSLKGELRLALEEVARLRADLDQITRQPRAPDRPSSGRLISEEQGEVIASVSEQLRQPLASILGYTDLLLSESVGILGALQRRFLERVKSATMRVVGMVEVIIQTVLEGERLELAPEPVRLPEVIHQAIQQHSNAIQRKNLDLQVDLQAALPTIHFDRDALLQALSYLIQNAYQASPATGQIVIGAQLQRGENQRDYVLLKVSDQGGGIPPEARGRLFTRRDRSTESPLPGTGDNSGSLPIVKNLVEAHGGRVWVDSEMGLGSTYYLILPVSQEAQQVAGIPE